MQIVETIPKRTIKAIAAYKISAEEESITVSESKSSTLNSENRKGSSKRKNRGAENFYAVRTFSDVPSARIVELIGPDGPFGASIVFEPDDDAIISLGHVVKRAVYQAAGGAAHRRPRFFPYPAFHRRRISVSLKRTNLAYLKKKKPLPKTLKDEKIRMRHYGKTVYDLRSAPGTAAENAPKSILDEEGPENVSEI